MFVHFSFSLMKKNNKKTTQNDPVIVFIGKSNTIKSLKMAKQVAAYVDSKYNSHVNIYSRVKKPTPFIEVRVNTRFHCRR